MKNSVFRITISGIFLALGLLLPFLTMQIPEFGSMLCPMHLPVLILGFVCGWKYALVVGFIMPVLRFVLFTMPPLYPTAIAMSFELAAYGLFSGLFHDFFRKTKIKRLLRIYFTLIPAMMGGRIVWGIAMYFLTLISGASFSFDLFLAGAFIKAWPGILIHLFLVPPVVTAIGNTEEFDN